MSLMSPALAGGFFTTAPPGKPFWAGMGFKVYLGQLPIPKNLLSHIVSNFFLNISSYSQLTTSKPA